MLLEFTNFDAVFGFELFIFYFFVFSIWNSIILYFFQISNENFKVIFE